MAQIYLHNEWQQATPNLIVPIIRNGRAERRLAVKERRRAAAMQRAAKLALIRAEVDEKQHIKDVRKVLHELGLDKPDDPWGPYICMSSPAPERKRAKKKQKIIRPSNQLRRLPSYRKPLIDARGRETLYLDISYLGLSSKSWRSGLAADHTEYCSRWDALEDPETQYREPISNIAHTMDEAIEFWKAVEPIEKEYRSNARVQVRFVGSLPAELNADQRREAVRQFCHGNFGRYSLGYTAFIHQPDPDGDQRNFHFHVQVTQRQCTRIGEFQWAISTEKMTEIFTPEGLYRVRCIFAAALNRQCRKAGSPRRFSHQDYNTRNIDALRTEKLGASRTNAFRNGENVVMVDRNRDRIKSNESRYEAQKLRRALDQAEAVRRQTDKVQKLAEKQAVWAKIRAKVGRISQAFPQYQAVEPIRNSPGASDEMISPIAPVNSSASAIKPQAMPRAGAANQIDHIAALACKIIALERAPTQPKSMNYVAFGEVMKVQGAAQKVAQMTQAKVRNSTRFSARHTILEVADKAHLVIKAMTMADTINDQAREGIKGISALAELAIFQLRKRPARRLKDAFDALIDPVAGVSGPSKPSNFIKGAASDNVAKLANLTGSMPQQTKVRDFAQEVRAASEILRGMEVFSSLAEADDDQIGDQEPSHTSATEAPKTLPQGEAIAGHCVGLADDEDDYEHPSDGELFLAGFNAPDLIIQRLGAGVFTPHDWYLKQYKLAPADFGDKPLQAELADRFRKQEEHCEEIAALMAERFSHRHLNARLDTIAADMPPKYHPVLNAWNDTPIVPELWAQAQKLGQKATREAVEKWQGSPREHDIRFELAVRAEDRIQCWPIQLDRVVRDALTKDADEGKARAIRQKAASDSASGDTATHGLAHVQATPEEARARRPTPPSQPQKAPENCDPFDDILDAEFDAEFPHLEDKALRTPGFADANRDGARTNAAATLVDRYGVSPQAAEFILSLVPRLCRKVDSKALKEGDDAVIDKLEAEKQERLRKALADEKMRKLWHDLCARLAEAGKRHAKRLCEKWSEVDRDPAANRDRVAWLARQACESWPDGAASPPDGTMLKQAKAYDEKLKKQEIARQQNGYGQGW
ncbi:MAG: MobA/MobL family protein [Erythrobacter sp.]